MASEIKGLRRCKTLAEVVSPEVLEKFIQSRPNRKTRNVNHLFPELTGGTVSIRFRASR